LASCRAPRRVPLLSSRPHPSIPSSLSLLAEKTERTEPPLPPLLRRARTCFSLHHRASSPANSYTLNSSTPSSHPCPLMRHGKATLPFLPPRELAGVRPRDGSPWSAQYRAPLLFLALVPSFLSTVETLVKTLPQMPVEPSQNTAAHCRAMAAVEVLTWPHHSTPSRSTLVA
jgi:hypothetical protein